MGVFILGQVPEYIGRMNAEAVQLDGKIQAITAFLQSQKYEQLPVIEQHLMVAQATAMQTYAAILGARINLAIDRHAPTAANT